MEYLNENFQKKPEWQNSTIWLEIVKALIEKKNYEENLKQKKMNEMDKVLFKDFSYSTMIRNKQQHH